MAAQRRWRGLALDGVLIAVGGMVGAVVFSNVVERIWYALNPGAERTLAVLGAMRTVFWGGMIGVVVGSTVALALRRRGLVLLTAALIACGYIACAAMPASWNIVSYVLLLVIPFAARAAVVVLAEGAHDVTEVRALRHD